MDEVSLIEKIIKLDEEIDLEALMSYKKLKPLYIPDHQGNSDENERLLANSYGQSDFLVRNSFENQLQKHRESEGACGSACTFGQCLIF